ncbi:MAG TPA: hypothetical protein VIS48_06620 [Candidatus Kryptonia bacterium]
MRIYLLTLCISILLVESAFTQVAHLQSEENGWGAVAGLISNTDGSGIGGSVDYCCGGNVDAALSLAQMNVMRSYPYTSFHDRTLTGGAYSLGFLMHVVKEISMSVPFSVSLSSGFAFGSYSAALSGYQSRLAFRDGHFYYGVSFRRNFNISSVVYVQPSIEIDYLEGFLASEGVNVEGEYENLHMYTATLAFPLAIRTSGTGSMVIDPSISVDKNRVRLTLVAGFLFGSN